MSEKNLKKANLGITFENKINRANEHYLDHDIAVIYKKPTPIQLVRVLYPKRSRVKIQEAYFKVPSTTDYNGIYKGRYIDFEAKSTKLTNFPFSRIYEHQIKHLIKVKNHGGISFILLEFSLIKEIYLIPIEEFIKYYYDESVNKRKSLAYKTVIEIGYLIKPNDYVEVNYIDSVEEYIEKKLK